MYKYSFKLASFLSLFLLVVVSGCDDKKKGDSFDRTALLTNLSNQIILPAHQSWATDVSDLSTRVNQFVASPSLSLLDSVKSAFRKSYVSYMAVETYSFMPSEGVRYLNSFPTDTLQINTNITSGSYDLNTASNIRAKGFPAIDYLLFSQSDAAILSLFSTDVQATNRKKLLQDLANDISNVASGSVSAWNGYTSQFISASGTDVGGSVGMLVNDLSYESERDRRERVGTPLGYVGLINSGTFSPLSAEACYGSFSNTLLIENLVQLKNLYTGGNATGFDDYLTYLNADYYGEPLATAITHQFDLVIQKAQTLPAEIPVAVSSNNADVESLFLELKKLTVLLKVDMSSQLGVIINYSDNDGD